MSLLCFMVFGPPGVAFSGLPQAASPLPGTAIQAFGRDRQCAAWTDGCVTCVKGAGETAQCSTPGIACTPKTITCTARP